MDKKRLLIIFFLCYRELPCHQCLEQHGFLLDFANEFNSKMIVMHTKEPGIKKTVMKNLILRASQQGIYVAIPNGEVCDIITNSADLHYIDDHHRVEYILECLERRRNHQKEPWIIDIGIASKEDIIKELENANLDLDDDVLVIRKKNNDHGHTMEIYELYKIAYDKPVQCHDIGTWSEENGLKMTTVHKWYRRADLKVNVFKSYRSGLI